MWCNTLLTQISSTSALFPWLPTWAISISITNESLNTQTARSVCPLAGNLLVGNPLVDNLIPLTCNMDLFRVCCKLCKSAVTTSLLRRTDWRRHGWARTWLRCLCTQLSHLDGARSTRPSTLRFMMTVCPPWWQPTLDSQVRITNYVFSNSYRPI